MVRRAGTAARHDGHVVLPRARDAGPDRRRGHGAVARKAVRRDVPERGQRRRLLQPAAEPRRRAGLAGRACDARASIATAPCRHRRAPSPPRLRRPVRERQQQDQQQPEHQRAPDEPDGAGQEIGVGRLAEPELRPEFGLSDRPPAADRRACTPSAPAPLASTMPACSPPSCAAHAFACVRQQKAASSKSPTMANDSAVSRAGTQSSSQSSARAGPPNTARASRDRRRIRAAGIGAPFVGEQHRRAVEHGARGSRQHREPEQRREDLPVRIHESALDGELRDLAARQLRGGAAAPGGKRAPRRVEVVRLQRRLDRRCTRG